MIARQQFWKVADRGVTARQDHNFRVLNQLLETRAEESVDIVLCSWALGAAIDFDRAGQRSTFIKNSDEISFSCQHLG